MRYLIENHSADAPHDGHTFSDEFVQLNWTGLYLLHLQFLSRVGRGPLLFLDPFGKWPDPAQQGQIATMFDQWQRCRDADVSIDVSSLASLYQFEILGRMRNPMVFKIGYIPADVTQEFIYQSLCPFIRTFGRRAPTNRPTICIDGLAAEGSDPEFVTLVMREMQAYGFPVMAEGWVYQPIPGVKETLLQWSAVVANGGIFMLHKMYANAIVIYAPEYEPQPMTMDDVKAIERLGHSVAFTPDVFPEA
jgi:hypothetical protein